MSKNTKLVPKRRFKKFKNIEEWRLSYLEDLLEFYSGLTYSPKNIVEKGGTLVLRSSNVKDCELVLLDKVYVDSICVNSELVQYGDIIVVVRNGSKHLIGKHALIKKHVKNTVIGAFMTGIRYKIPEFMNSLLDTKRFNNEIEKNLGATINQITIGHFRKMMFYIPDDIEQKDIGAFFAKLDTLIQTQQKKLEKTKTLKSAYLAEMFPCDCKLKPKLQFKDFINYWDSISLNKIGSTYAGLSGKSKDDFGHGNAEYITYVNIFNNPITDLNGTETIEIDDKQNQVKYGDVLFTISSETPHEVGLSSVWLGDRENVYLNSFCFGFRPYLNVDNYYFAFMLRSPVIRKKFKILAQGISRYNISKNRVMKLVVPITHINEQTKIGNFFKLLDKKIALEQRKLEKLNNIKQAYLNEMFV